MMKKERNLRRHVPGNDSVNVRVEVDRYAPAVIGFDTGNDVPRRYGLSGLTMPLDDIALCTAGTIAQR